MDVRNIILKTMDSFLHIADIKGIKLSTHIAEDVPDVLIGDSVRLEQVLINLTSNAVKFTEEGKVKIGVKVLSEKGDAYKLKFSVKDTSIGMTEDQAENLFKPFTQADSSTTRKYGGSGLGLAICKDLVKLMGGKISVKSVYEKGSEFIFVITLNKSKEKSDSKEHDSIAEQLENVQNIRILLVEDNEINQMVASELLESKGFAVDTANNGREAVDILSQANDYDVILMDL